MKRLSDKIRTRHIYIIGKTGTGKTTFLANAVIQDVLQGKGVAVIDPVGTLVSRLLDLIPQSRVEDTIYFGKDCLIPFWNWKVHSQDEANSLALDMISVFERITKDWGVRMHAIIAEAVHALIAIPTLNFLDLHDFLLHEGFRRRYVHFLPPERRKFWEQDFLKLYHSPNTVQPIITRLFWIKNSTPMKVRFGTRRAPVDIPDLMDSKKILLINLAEFHPEDVKAIGLFFVSKFEAAIRRRAEVPQNQRIPFYLYIDEFQDFVYTTLDKFFDRARNFRICLAVSHQRTSQLTAEMLDAALGAGTLFFFSIIPKDARCFADYIAPYEPEFLVNLPEYHAIVHCKGKVGLLRTLTPARKAKGVPSYRDDILRRSRQLAAASLPQDGREVESHDIEPQPTGRRNARIRRNPASEENP